MSVVQDSRFTGLHTASADATWDTTVVPPTIAGQEPQDRLVRAIMNLATSQPQILFAGAYLLTTDVVYGAQGIVVFARGRDAGMRQYAIKCGLVFSSQRSRGQSPRVYACYGAVADQAKSQPNCRMCPMA